MNEQNNGCDPSAPWCDTCSLRLLPLFKSFSPSELRSMQDLKIAHRVAPAKTILVRNNESSGQVFTLFSGWAFRHTSLPDGRRQILNVLLPGDMIGLYATLIGQPYFSVQTATEVSYCVLDERRLRAMSKAQHGLGIRVAELALREVATLELRLTVVGQCSAEERTAYFLLDLYHRLQGRHLVRDHQFGLPLTQQELADALGLNIIHLNRVLRRLRERGLVTIQRGKVTVHDMAGLQRMVPLTPMAGGQWPLL
jgi:CRP-like cAMP-binding protein